MRLSSRQKAILDFLQQDLAVSSSPFLALKRKLRINEDEIVNELVNLKRAGYIRRYGAILNHRKVGLKENCMCVWKVSSHVIKEMVRITTDCPQISHCYLRKTTREWPYNFYTMIHGRSKAECLNIIERIAKASQVSDYQPLFTIKEFKKISPRYKF